MSISDRYRALVEDVEGLLSDWPEVGDDEAVPKEIRLIRQARAKLDELTDQVGDIPRIRLEFQLTPVLLKAHGLLDRARLHFEEEGEEDRGAQVWELEQKIYRLLNDL